MIKRNRILTWMFLTLALMLPSAPAAAQTPEPPTELIPSMEAAPTSDPVLTADPGLTADGPNDWPQYGRDPQRSNYSPVQVDPPYCFAWKWYEAPLASRAQPVVSAGRLFIGSMDGVLYARDATSGAPLWSYNARSPIRHSAAVYNGTTVIFTTHAGLTIALNAATGSLVWSRQTGSSSTAPLVDPTAGRVYLASADGTLTALNAASGGLVWSAGLGAPILTTPALSVDGNVIYTGTEYIEAVAVNAQSGAVLWRTRLQGQSLADRSPVVAGSQVYYRSQPLDFFHVLLQSSGDAVMDQAGGWSLSWNTTWAGSTWAADWANVRTRIVNHLNANPHQQTFFALNAASGALNASGPAPVLYTFGNNDIPSQPVASPAGLFLPYRARHGIQTDSNTVHVSTKYDAELGRMDPASLDITGLTSSGKINSSGTVEFRMTSDEPAILTMGGNILWVDNWERLGGLNVSSGALVHGAAVSNDWPECYVQCGPGSPRNFFPMSGTGPAYPFPNPRVTEGHQRSGAVIANNMVYWRVIEGGIGALNRQSGTSCPAPQVWGPGANPQRPSAPPSNNRSLGDYLDLDLTQPRADAPADLVNRLRAEVDTLVSANGHWMPFYLERGFSYTAVWPYNTTKTERPPLVGYNAHGNVYFHDPGDLLLAMAQAYPYLDPALQTKTKNYMAAEMGRFPPLSDLPFFSSGGTQDWLRSGIAREGYNVPFRSQLNNWPPAAANLNALYALWLWSKNTGDWSYAQARWNDAKAFFDARTPPDHANGKMDYFSDLAGVIGYYRLAVKFGNAAEANRARTIALNFMNEIKANPQAFFSRADNQYLDPRDETRGWYAPALFGLTPEVGLFLREQTGGAAATYLIDKEYGVNGNGLRWWYLTRAGAHAEIGESSFAAPNAAWSHFLGHAYLLGKSREDLLPVLDRPWGKADVYSIQKITAALQASPKSPNFSGSAISAQPPSGPSGAELAFTVLAVNSGIAPSGPVTITVTLPAGLTYVGNTLAMEPPGTNSVAPSTITWQGTQPSNGVIRLTFRAFIGVPANVSQALAVGVQISNPDTPAVQLTTIVFANPKNIFLPVTRK